MQSKSHYSRGEIMKRLRRQLSTLIYDAATVTVRALVVAVFFLVIVSVVVMTAVIIVPLALLRTFASIRGMLMGNVKSATGIYQETPSSIAADYVNGLASKK
jgi:hypothetical protein